MNTPKSYFEFAVTAVATFPEVTVLCKFALSPSSKCCSYWRSSVSSTYHLYGEIFLEWGRNWVFMEMKYMDGLGAVCNGPLVFYTQLLSPWHRLSNNTVCQFLVLSLFQCQASSGRHPTFSYSWENSDSWSVSILSASPVTNKLMRFRDCHSPNPRERVA